MSTLLRKFQVAVLPNSVILKRKFENGAIIRGFNKPGFGGRGIFIYGESLEPELDALHLFLKPGFVFIDVGSNSGAYTLKAAKEVGNEGVVISIEPFPDMAAFLSKSVEINGCTNVRIRTVCISDTTAHTTLWLNKGKPTQFSLNREQQDAGMSVLGVTIDELCKWEQLSRVDYIKIDVQGAEAKVLTGAKKIIKTFRPIIQAEIEVNKIDIELLNYRIFRATHSPNMVYIPKENRDGLAVAVKLNWPEL